MPLLQFAVLIAGTVSRGSGYQPRLPATPIRPRSRKMPFPPFAVLIAGTVSRGSGFQPRLPATPIRPRSRKMPFPPFAVLIAGPLSRGSGFIFQEFCESRQDAAATICCSDCRIPVPWERLPAAITGHPHKTSLPQDAVPTIRCSDRRTPVPWERLPAAITGRHGKKRRSDTKSSGLEFLRGKQANAKHDADSDNRGSSVACNARP